MLEEKAAALDTTVWRQVTRVLRLRTIVVVIALQALTFAVIAPTVTFLPIYVQADNGPFHLNASETALLTGFVVVVGGICGTLLGGAAADFLGRRTPSGRVLAAGFAYALALPCFAVMLLSHSLPLFTISSTLAVLALSMPTGPLAAASQDVTPPTLRATAVAVILLGSHLFGDVWSPGAVGALSTHLHEHADQALLLIGLPLLALAALVGILGARFYAREVVPAGSRASGRGSPAFDEEA
jgi:MFS family permease